MAKSKCSNGKPLPCAGSLRPFRLGEHSQDPTSTVKTISCRDAPSAKPCLSACEIQNMVRNYCQSFYGDILHACKNFDLRNTGKILRHQLKQVLRTYCLPLTSCQFDCLCPMYETDPCGRICYRDFLESITGGCGQKHPTDVALNEYIPRKVTIDQVQIMMKYKIENNLKNFCKALALYDYAKDGFILKREFRKVLENFCFKLTDTQFDTLWQIYDPHNVGSICYEDFLQNFGKRVDDIKKRLHQNEIVQTLCWTNQDHQECKDQHRLQNRRKYALEEYIDDPCIAGLQFSEVLKLFLSKLLSPGLNKQLVHACILSDPEETGMIQFDAFHPILHNFVMPMSKALFTQLMADCMAPLSKRAKLNWKYFVNKFCNKNPVYIEPPKDPYAHLIAKAIKVIDKIKEYVPNPKDRVVGVKTFLNKEGYRIITRTEFKRAIEQSGFFLTGEEYSDLFALLDPGQTNLFLVKDYLDLFDYPTVSPCNVVPPGSVKRRLNNCEIPAYRAVKDSTESVANLEISKQCFPHLRNHQLKGKLKKYVNRNWEHIYRACRSVDRAQTDCINVRALRMILERYCFQLTDEQWDEFLEDFTNSHTVNYKLIMDTYKRDPDETAKKYYKNVSILMKENHKNQADLSLCEVKEIVRDFVKSKRNALLKDFAQVDYSNVGTVAKEVFYRLIHKHMFRMTLRQFEDFWTECPRSHRDRLLYLEFLQEFGCIPQQSLPPGQPPCCSCH